MITGPTTTNSLFNYAELFRAIRGDHGHCKCTLCGTTLCWNSRGNHGSNHKKKFGVENVFFVRAVMLIPNPNNIKRPLRRRVTKWFHKHSVTLDLYSGDQAVGKQPASSTSSIKS